MGEKWAVGHLQGQIGTRATAESLCQIRDMGGNGGVTWI